MLKFETAKEYHVSTDTHVFHMRTLVNGTMYYAKEHVSSQMLEMKPPGFEDYIKRRLIHALFEKMEEQANFTSLHESKPNLLEIQNSYNQLMLQGALVKPTEAQIASIKAQFAAPVDTYKEKAASEFEGVDELDPKLWGEGVDGFF